MNLSLFRNRPASKAIASTNGFARLHDEIDRTFNRFLSEPFGAFDAIEPKDLRLNGWIPPLDISESDTEITIRAEIPGIAAKDLDISVSGTTLTLSGKKDEVTEKNEENFYQCERRFGSFRRVVELPESVDSDKINAEADNGVLTVRVAKKPGSKPKQIEIKPTVRKVTASS